MISWIAGFYRRALTRPLLRNAAWLFAGDGFSLAIQAVYFVILAKLLGPVQYGLLAGAIALVAMVSQYSTLGSSLLFMRYVSADHDRFSYYWGNLLLSTVLMGSGLVVVLWLSAPRLIGRGSLSLVVPLAIADCLFQQFGSAAGQVFQTFERMRACAGVTLATNAMRCLAAISFYIWLHAITAQEWARATLLISGLSAAIAFALVSYNFGRPRFSLSLLGRRSGEGFIFAVSAQTTAVYNDIDKVVLAHMGLHQANGIYSLAYRAINIGSMPIRAFAGAALPGFFRHGARGAHATEPMARRLLKKTAGLGLAISCACWLLAPLIPHVVGEPYREAASALRWLCLIPFFRTFHLSAGDAIAGAGHQKFRLLSQSIAAGGNLLLNLYLIPLYSWRGAAAASLMTDAALGLMNWSALLWIKRRHSFNHPVIESAA